MSMRFSMKHFARGIVMCIMFICILAISHPANAASLKISSKTKTMHIGRTTVLRLRNYKKGKITWTASDSTMVTVKKLSKGKCKIRAKKTGVVTITCKKGKKTFTCKITIKNHNFKKKSTKKATCRSTGKITYRCSCGKTKTVKIARKSHKYKTVSTTATCVRKGIKVKYCKVCGKVKSSQVTPALGHEAPETTEATTETTTATEPTTGSTDQSSTATTAEKTTTGETSETYVCVRCKQVIDPTTQKCVKETDHKYVNGVCIYCGVKKVSEVFFASLKKVGAKMVAKKWKYSNSGVGSTYATAKSRKKANCAAYVSFAMQEAGLLEKGYMFYSGTKGSLHMSDSQRKLLVSEGAVFYTYSSGIKVKDLKKQNNLQEGDIVLWNYHTNVFKGYDSKGRPTWYDAGKSCTKKKKSGSKYICYQRTGYTGFTSNNKVYGIIRFLQ